MWGACACDTILRSQLTVSVSYGGAMAKVVALYKRPADAAAFDSYYYSKHIPIAKKIPGLRRAEASVGPVSTRPTLSFTVR